MAADDIGMQPVTVEFQLMTRLVTERGLVHALGELGSIKRARVIGISASLVFASAATANTVSFKCRLLTSRVRNVPYTLDLALDQDGKALYWKAGDRDQLLDAAIGKDTVSFRGPYTDTPSSFEP